MDKVVILSGAGVSAESGIRTFRDSDGLWEQYRIEDVATPEAWRRNRSLVLDFYNQRRKQVLEAKPNPAHEAIASLQTKYDVRVVTQNIDDLHERGGARNVLHLHGEIRKARSTVDPSIVDIGGWELKEGDRCPKGSQLRPHIVWFGELVPELENAAELVSTADIFIVVGTSLQVYPAAGLIRYAPPEARKFLIDPNAPPVSHDFRVFHAAAGTALPGLVDELLR